MRFAIILIVAMACTRPPPPLELGARGAARIVVIDDHGDEWLYEHCDYHGTAIAYTDAHAYALAAARHSNVIEPIYRYTSSSSTTTSGATTVTSTSRHAVVLFACKENVPW